MDSTSTMFSSDGPWEDTTVHTPVMRLADMGKRFTHLDYFVFCAMLAGSALIGVYYACSGGKQKTAQEFLMGDRKMGIFPITMSLVASFTSAIAMLGFPAEVYTYGTMMMMSVFGLLMAVPTSAYLILPVFYNLGTTSVYEYLERRFNKLARTLGCAIYIIQTLMYSSIVVYAPSLALSQVTGMHFVTSVLITTSVCIFYTSIGGLKAVVWTDVFQMILMVGALFAVIIVGCYEMGGLPNVIRIANEGQRIKFFDFNLDPTVRLTTFSLVFGKFITMAATFGCKQTNVQRYLALGSIRRARIAALYSMVGFAVFNTISFFIGIVVYAKYAGCDPKTAGVISAPDQILPLFVVDTFSSIPGMPGFFVAGVMSASLSTISSVLNSLAAVALEDFVKPFIAPNITEEKAATVAKFLATGFGLICVVIILLIDQEENVVQNTTTILGTVSGPLCGLFALGLFFPHANSFGGVIGFCTGIITCFWIVIGKMTYKPYWPTAPVSTEECFADPSAGNFTFKLKGSDYDQLMRQKNENIFPLYRISFLWYGVIGCFTVIFTGVILSYAYRIVTHRRKPVEKVLMCQPFINALIRFGILSENSIVDNATNGNIPLK